VVGIASGKLPVGASEAELSAWGQQLMGDYLAVTDDGDKATDVKVEQLSVAQAVKAAGLILAEGNAYDTSNPDNANGLINGAGDKSDPDDYQLGIKDVNAKLGTPLKAFVVSGKRDDHEGGTDKVGMAIFMNTKTGEFVGYYGREGHV
jgi:hypothetical protein